MNECAGTEYAGGESLHAIPRRSCRLHRGRNVAPPPHQDAPPRAGALARNEARLRHGAIRGVHEPQHGIRPLESTRVLDRAAEIGVPEKVSTM